MQRQIITINEFLAMLNYKSRTSYYNLEKNDPNFPQRVKIGPRKIGIYLDDVYRWLDLNRF